MMDREFAAVRDWIAEPARVRGAGLAIRHAIDWVIDGARTRRYGIDQLKTAEKIYIGNRVEHEILHEWGLVKERPLDAVIQGVPVDIKFSISEGWMIPPEAMDQLCVMVKADDANSEFSVGLFRARRNLLGHGAGNRDAKWNLVRAGKEAIHWVAIDAPLPENFLLHLPHEVREKILSHRSGQARVTEMFRLVLGKPIPTTAIDTLAVQRDPSKRIRKNGGAKDALEQEGIRILGWRYDRARIEALGLPPLEPDHWISIRVP